MTISAKTMTQTLRRLFGHDAPPSAQDHRKFEKVCIRYLRSHGWRVANGEMFEYFGESENRRIFIRFYPAERTITETHIIDWHQMRVRVGRPTYIICQDAPHQAYIKLGAERGLVIRHYLDISILDSDTESGDVTTAALRDGASVQ